MVAVIKYNAGNVQSVMCALKRLSADAVLTDDENVIRSVDHVIFPGVGEASSAIRYLRKRNMDEILKSIKVPFLGICLGMQLLSSDSEEGNTHCLDITGSHVVAFEKNRGYKIPHMGWNTIRLEKETPLFNGIDDETFFYFVHSYYAELSEHTIASSDYAGVRFSAAVAKDNYYGLQFHPEKSGKSGLKVLSNFLEMKI